MNIFNKVVEKITDIIDHSDLFHIFLLGISSIVLAIIGLFSILLNQDIDISKLKTDLMQPTVIYDVNGKEASKISANKTEGVPINKIPKHVREAVLAIEDRRFYEHGGVDYKGIMRAAYENLTKGGITQGGSTITQQLAKITLLTPEQTLKRKLKEVAVAKEIEYKYSKNEILEMYLNQIYFGHGAWGIQNASRAYFGKTVEDLSISEAAMLAGLIHAPSVLDPYKNKKAADDRQHVVLKQMKRYGFITEKEYEEAKSEKIVLRKESDPLKGKYPYYVDQVIVEATEKYGMDQDELLTGGYKIYTELDQRMQKATEEVYQKDELFTRGSNPDEQVQSGSVTLDPKTGGIRALVGGRGDHVFLGYNRATQLKAQPGSTMKPLAVYTPALEEGYKITDFLEDEEMEFAGGYAPKNYNGEYAGQVPMFEAVIESKNIPAVWLLNEIGIQKGLDSAEKFGIPMEEGDRKLGLALGGLERGTSPLQMASAYSVFVNDGKRTDAHVITKIINANGTEVAAYKKKETKVTTKKIAKDITTMLKGVVDNSEGTGTNAKVDGRDVAGKTGTTQVNDVNIKNAVKDQWFVGYSPNLVTAVWTGYDKTTSSQYLLTDRSRGSNIVFKEMMSESLKYVDEEEFDVPTIDDLNKQVKKERFKNYWKQQKEKLNERIDKWKDKWNENDQNAADDTDKKAVNEQKQVEEETKDTNEEEPKQEPSLESESDNQASKQVSSPADKSKEDANNNKGQPAEETKPKPTEPEAEKPDDETTNPPPTEEEDGENGEEEKPADPPADTNKTNSTTDSKLNQDDNPSSKP